MMYNIGTMKDKESQSQRIELTVTVDLMPTQLKEDD